MKKICNTIALTLFLFIIVGAKQVSALSLNDDGTYTNKNNIIMSEKQKDNLKSLGFNDYEIDHMNSDEFESNKDLEGTLVSTETRYFKTTTVTPSPYFRNVAEPYFFTEEMTEEEYMNDPKVDITPRDYYTEWTTTEYKRMTVDISSVNGRYRYKVSLWWDKMPKTRSYDIIGIKIDNTVSGIPNTKQFKATYELDNTAGYCRTKYNTSPTWKLSPQGYIATFKLQADTSSEKVYAMSMYMYFEVQKINATPILVVNAYGDYKHAQKTVQSSVSNSITFDSKGSLTFSVGTSSTIVESYDTINTVHAYLNGIYW